MIVLTKLEILLHKAIEMIW